MCLCVHMGTHTICMAKMADDTDECVEGCLIRLVSVKERSGNLRKDLKKEIVEAVSSLRRYLA